MSLVTNENDEFVLTSSVLNKEICMDIESFGKCLRVPYEGLVLVQGSIPDEWESYNKIKVFLNFCRESQQASIRQQNASKLHMFGSNLSVSDRMLHYIIAYVLFPKNSNHSRINEFELQVLYALNQGIPINWAFTMLHHMNHLVHLNGGLPYARPISRIIERAGISL